MSKLLHKPLKAFAFFALVILACSIPVYYLIVDSIWLEELDEHNQIVLEQTQNGFRNFDGNKEAIEKGIALLKQVRPGVTIFPVENAGNDSVYTSEKIMTHNGETERDRFRGLVSFVEIGEKPYKIVVETNVEEGDDTFLAISGVTLLFFAFLIIGFIFLNRRLSKKIWQPFIDTLEKLKRFDLNSSSTPNFSSTDIEEFNELNLVLKKLIENNILIFNQQKEFLQNASHELQTPLALLRSRIDILIQDSSLTQQQREIINSLYTSVSRASKINKDLLLLAGIENKIYPTTSVALNEVVVRNLNDLKEFFPGERTVDHNLTSTVILNTNESLLEILVNNLISNSFRHSNSNAKISVELSDRNLTIRNTGNCSLKTDALFKRFQSASSGNPGTGLGLSISKEICNKYNWAISYEFSENQHQFSVMF